MEREVRVRFAPSPTGGLHIGGARTALFNWAFARHQGGTFVLRIEDTDRQRSRPEFETALLEDLAWLGLDWEEGPSRDGPAGPYRQSERLPLYRSQLDRLLEAGAAYPCFCTEEALQADREEQRRLGLAPRYVGRCRGIEPSEVRVRLAAEPHVIRFRLEEAVAAGGAVVEDLIRGPVDFGSRRFGDPILWRQEAGPTYNFAVVVDDAAMRISHVLRGEDHLPNTPLQIHLARALGRAAPAFGHLPLVSGPDGAPLSKREGSTAISLFRRAGYLPEAMLNYLALLGWSPPDGEEVFGVDALVRAFDLRRVGHAAASFDHAKLAFINGRHLRSLDSARLGRLAAEFLAGAGFLPSTPSAATLAFAQRFSAQFLEQISTLGELPARARLLFEPREEVGPVEGPEVVQAFAAALSETAGVDGPISAEALRAAISEAGRRTGHAGRKLLHPIRVALTGHSSGPPLETAVALIDEAARLSFLRPVVSCRERLAEALTRSRDDGSS